MRHEGHVWVALEPDTDWQRGSVELDVHQIVVRRGDVVLRTWPINSVRRSTRSGATILAVGSDLIYLRPDDAAALAADLGQFPLLDGPAPPTTRPTTVASTVPTNRPVTAPAVRPKDPGIAAVLSALITGLGQLYNGQIVKGLVFFGASAMSWFLTIILIGWLFLPVVWVWGIVDAYRSADRINRRAGSFEPFR